jgi:two-component system, OmpR family, alkaline phosphatase synthesis response regulator PhoP
MKKILVIEDEKAVRDNLVDLLTENNYEVTTSENGFLGAISALENEPDLIICDVMMPDMDGFEVFQALRSSSNTVSIPFIFLTALNDLTSIRKGMNLGADDYLTKPYKGEDLLKAIKARVSRKQELQNADTDRVKQKAINKILVALYAVSTIKCPSSKDKALDILQIVCDSEIELLSKIPDLQKILSPDDLDTFNQLRKSPC